MGSVPIPEFRRSRWDQLSTLLGCSIWRPLQGASLLVNDSQGWNSGLSSVAPSSGHKTRASAQDCGLQIFRSKIIVSLIFVSSRLSDLSLTFRELDLSPILGPAHWTCP